MSDDNNILDRLSAAQPGNNHEDDGTPVPIRINREPRETVEEALRRAEEEERQGRDIVTEYHEKYYGNSLYGYCRGDEPVRYIQRINIYYDILKRQGIEYRNIGERRRRTRGL